MMEKLIEKIYYGSGPGAFQGENRLYAAAKLENPQVTVDEVRQFLQHNKNAQLYQEPGKRKHILKAQRHFEVSGPGHLSIDIFYLSQFTGQWRFCVVVVDMFTHYIMVRFLRQLNSKTVTEATKSVTKTFEFPVRSITSDRGKEFLATFQEYCKEENIKHVFTSPQATSKTVFPELYIRYLRRTAAKILAARKGAAKDAIETAAHVHNQTPSKSLNGYRPDEIRGEKVGLLVQARNRKHMNLEEDFGGLQKPKFRINEHVRVREERAKFWKSNLPNWSADVYKVIGIINSSPRASYELSSLTTEIHLPGSFPEYKLIRANGAES